MTSVVFPEADPALSREKQKDTSVFFFGIGAQKIFRNRVIGELVPVEIEFLLGNGYGIRMGVGIGNKGGILFSLSAQSIFMPNKSAHIQNLLLGVQVPID